MYDYEYENNVLLFLRLLKFLHTDQPEVLEEIIKDYPMAGDEDIEMIMNELMLTVFDEGAPDDEDDMVTVRFPMIILIGSTHRAARTAVCFPFESTRGRRKSRIFFFSMWQMPLTLSLMFATTSREQMSSSTLRSHQIVVHQISFSIRLST